ncbi:hypothetical protein DFH06DRAFT_1130698 [Mycena polygramma]|nr:hypothetical protein DFH06DRAFT_1130698 [Mycena polygramma]
MFSWHSLFCNPTGKFEPQHRFAPTVLGSIRALFAICGVATIVVSMSLRAQPSAAQSFSYLSNITWWGITFYHLFAAFHTLVYARTGRAPLDAWPRPLQLVHSLLFSTVVTLSLMLTIVFWATQFTPDKFDTSVNAWSNVSHHALNSAFALFEILFSRTAHPPWIHGPLVVLLLGGYACIAYITHATQGFYPYGFLNPAQKSRGALAGIIIGMGALGAATFGVACLLIWLRFHITENVLRWRGKFSRRDTGENQSTDVETNSQGLDKERVALKEAR